AYSTLIGLVYFVGLWAWRGQTVGMMPFNMQVVAVSDGKKIDVVRGVLRYVGIILSIIPLFLGLIWVAFDSRKQGWHDKIAGTVVIRPN
ncbi:MAG: RDD family protein, partial [Pseudomonadota bacterium]